MCQLAVADRASYKHGDRQKVHRRTCARQRRQNTGVNTIAFTPTSSKYALCKHFHGRQKPRTPPLRARICLKAQHQIRAILPSLHQQSTHLSNRPSILSVFFPILLCSFCRPVQSESLVELRLSAYLQKLPLSFE